MNVAEKETNVAEIASFQVVEPGVWKSRESDLAVVVVRTDKEGMVWYEMKQFRFMQCTHIDVFLESMTGPTMQKPDCTL